MTIQQQAHNLIDTLPDESVMIIINLMSLLPKKKPIIIDSESVSDKQIAFRKMQELRKITVKYNLGALDEERENAFLDKYSDLGKTGA